MLELKHISKTFNPGTVNEKQALVDFSLTLEDGELVSAKSNEVTLEVTLIPELPAFSALNVNVNLTL